MKDDFLIEGFSTPPHPKGLTFFGKSVRLEPLDIEKHSEDLHNANIIDVNEFNWRYLPYGPFENLEKYQKWLRSVIKNDDPTFLAIIRLSDDKAVGVASFLRINRSDGSIEVGHINYSPLLQKTKEGTEAMYLMMKWTFENGYRRYEWKCNALNLKSRYAAQRLGFSYEGVFRQMSISKGKNRNTAWFASIDKEWPRIKAAFETYLSDANFSENNQPKISLTSLTKPILFKIDNKEFS